MIQCCLNQLDSLVLFKLITFYVSWTFEIDNSENEPTDKI